MKIIIRENPGPWFMGLWHANMCICEPDGPIVRFIKSLKSKNTLAIPWSDGLRFIDENSNNISSDFEGYEEDVLIGIQAYIFLGDEKAEAIFKPKNKFVCLPLDDETFHFGLKNILERRIPNLYLPWEERRPVVFWRGAGPHTLRQKVVEELFECEYADVLYGRIPGNTPDQWSQRWWDTTYEGKWQPIELSEFVKHKYILIIDNFIITSSYQWVFGSGSVPILINHPLNDFWFKEFLIPWVNYVPVTHPDFGVLNVRNVVEFLIKHDNVAKRIAENARVLSHKVFSPEFQKEYIKTRLDAEEIDYEIFLTCDI